MTNGILPEKIRGIGSEKHSSLLSSIVTHAWEIGLLLRSGELTGDFENLTQQGSATRISRDFRRARIAQFRKYWKTEFYLRKQVHDRHEQAMKVVGLFAEYQATSIKRFRNNWGKEMKNYQTGLRKWPVSSVSQNSVISFVPSI